MTTRETLTARFRQVLDEHEHGAAGVDLVERLTDVVFETVQAAPEGWSTEDHREAEAEAKYRWHVEKQRTRTTQSDFDNFNQGCINGFILGAEWQKARPVGGVR